LPDSLSDLASHLGNDAGLAQRFLYPAVAGGSGQRPHECVQLHQSILDRSVLGRDRTIAGDRLGRPCAGFPRDAQHDFAGAQMAGFGRRFACLQEQGVRSQLLTRPLECFLCRSCEEGLHVEMLCIGGDSHGY
jgi:hypothetical protein